jgi:hypothetical protein
VAIVVVGGSGKDAGKTGLVCAVIRSLPEFGWTAVKISGHDYRPGAFVRGGVSSQAVFEESSAGKLTDTGKYLEAGARRALLVTRRGDDVPIEEIKRALGPDRNLIFESNRIVDLVKPDVCVALVRGTERKASFVRLMRMANAIVIVGGTPSDDLPPGVPQFELEAPDRLSAEMVVWLRAQLIKNRPRREITDDEVAHAE